jgi:outer membrane autotransporter protein
MKKLVIMAAMALAAVSVSATEVGIRLGHSTGAGSTTSAGVTLGQKFGEYGVEGSFDRTTIGPANMNRYGITGSYDAWKLGDVTISPKIGVAYINPQGFRNGAAITAGVGASYPLTKQVSLTADYYYQRGQDRVRGYDGNYFLVGAKYSF